jgi:tRNA (guanine-N7-)-methyltransferase
VNVGYWQDFYQINSDQSAVHPQLERVVRRHCARAFQHPVSDWQAAVFDKVMAAASQPMILDCGCGTGMSSTLLAEQFPDHDVLGIDQSLHRLSRHKVFQRRQNEHVGQAGNLFLVRADVVSWWLMLAKTQKQVARAYFFYPNPWPKGKHLQRRWHGHAVWPLICGQADFIEMRTNWLLYAQEWQQALRWCDRQPGFSLLEDALPCSLFERKYRQADVDCYRVCSSG